MTPQQVQQIRNQTDSPALRQQHIDALLGKYADAEYYTRRRETRQSSMTWATEIPPPEEKQKDAEVSKILRRFCAQLPRGQRKSNIGKPPQ